MAEKDGLAQFIPPRLALDRCAKLCMFETCGSMFENYGPFASPRTCAVIFALSRAESVSLGRHTDLRSGLC